MAKLPGQIAGLGPVIQLAFVPRDFDAAIRYWTEVMGVGPFFYIEHLPLLDVKYRGTPTTIDSSVALGYWGDTQVELLRQHCDRPSAYREWLEAGRSGLHHVCVKVEDMAVARAALERAGGTPLHEARMLGAADAAYYEMPEPSPIIEIARLDPKFDQLFSYMRRTASQWDGSRPVRDVPSEEEWGADLS